MEVKAAALKMPDDFRATPTNL